VHKYCSSAKANEVINANVIVRRMISRFMFPPSVRCYTTPSLTGASKSGTEAPHGTWKKYNNAHKQKDFKEGI
jgi:hypothetical protein